MPHSLDVSALRAKALNLTVEENKVNSVEKAATQIQKKEEDLEHTMGEESETSTRRAPPAE